MTHAMSAAPDGEIMAANFGLAGATHFPHGLPPRVVVWRGGLEPLLGRKGSRGSRIGVAPDVGGWLSGKGWAPVHGAETGSCVGCPRAGRTGRRGPFAQRRCRAPRSHVDGLRHREASLAVFSALAVDLVAPRQVARS